MKHVISLIILCLFVLPVSADRYDDLMAKWGSNGNGGYDNPDAMSTAWVAVPRNDALLDAYEVNGDKSLVDLAHTAIDYLVRTTPKNNPNGLPAYLVLSVVPVPGIEIAGEEFRHLDLIAHFIEVVRNNQPELAEYNADADYYLSFLEDTMIPKWETYMITSATQDPTDYYYPNAAGITQPECKTCETDPYDAGGGALKLLSNPNNKQSDFATTMLRLWRITGKQKYYDIVRGVALNFKSKMLWTEGSTGWYYSWHYWDPIGDCDYDNCSGIGPPRVGVWIEHRAGYGNLDMSFVTECYREGILFCREDIQRYVRTNRDVMWDGITTALSHDTWLANDGSTPIDYGGLYQAIAPYDTTGKLTDLLYNYFDANSTGWNALGLPKFVRVMHETEPPDTMTWQGPLEVIKTEAINNTTIAFTFYNPVDPATITDTTNYSFSRGVIALSAVQDPADKRKVTVTTTAQSAGAGMKVRIRHVKDVYGNETFAYQYGNQPYEYIASAEQASISDHVPVKDALRPGRLTLSGNPITAGTAVRLTETGAQRIITDQTGAVVYRAAAGTEARWNTGDASGIYWIISAGLVQKLIVLP